MPSGCILNWCPYCSEAVWEDENWKVTPSGKIAHQRCHWVKIRVYGEIVSDEKDGGIRTIRIREGDESND